LYKHHADGHPYEHARDRSHKLKGGWHRKDHHHRYPTVANLEAVLRSEGVNARSIESGALDGSDVPAMIKHFVGPSTPAILQVHWTTGGQHKVVCRRLDPDGTLIFLDPWYGLVEMPVSRLPKYEVPGGRTQAVVRGGSDAGLFTGRMVLTIQPPLSKHHTTRAATAHR
jgi:hypothetical protein